MNKQYHNNNNNNNNYDCTSSTDKLDVLLGKSTGVSKTDDTIDMAVKRFLESVEVT